MEQNQPQVNDVAMTRATTPATTSAPQHSDVIIIELEPSHLERFLLNNRPSLKPKGHLRSTLWQRCSRILFRRGMKSQRTATSSLSSSTLATRWSHPSVGNCHQDETTEPNIVQRRESSSSSCNESSFVPDMYPWDDCGTEEHFNVAQDTTIHEPRTAEQQLSTKSQLPATPTTVQFLQQANVAIIRDLMYDYIRQANDAITIVQDFKKGLELYRHVIRLVDETITAAPAVSSVTSSSPEENSEQPPALLTPMELVHICYTCTRCAMTLGDYETALFFALREIQYSTSGTTTRQLNWMRCPSHTTETTETSTTSKSSPLSSNTDLPKSTTTTMLVAMAARYHDLAHICQYGLGDAQQALQYYQNALQVEMKCYRTLIGSSNNNTVVVAAKEDVSSGISNVIRIDEIRLQIQETRECIGRIHFESGNIEAALRML
jgi:hypothetical protein